MMPSREFIYSNMTVFKLIGIGILTLLLLIPQGLLISLIREREHTRDEAVRDIASKWGAPQTIAAPVLMLPYTVRVTQDGPAGVAVTPVTHYAYFLPEEVSVNAAIDPERRQRGIYEAILYKGELHITGRFAPLTLTTLNIPPADILWDKASVALGVSDLKGISRQIGFQWDGSSYDVFPGLPSTEVLRSGVHAYTPLGDPSRPHSFSIRLQLNGSEAISFVPVGKTTAVTLSSSWPHPSFQGEFLPVQSEVTDNGFTAQWQVIHLNRNFPQQWVGNQYTLQGTSPEPGHYVQRSRVESSAYTQPAAFGVTFFIPADHYQKTMRSLKYGILTIIVTFFSFFVVEIQRKTPFHVIQYLMIGFAICLFYLLLLSISEHIPFDFAYWIAALMTIVLIAAYTQAVFKRTRLSAAIAAILAALYLSIYILFALEDFSLLLGSLGLFILLAIAMYVTRKIDWYGTKQA